MTETYCGPKVWGDSVVLWITAVFYAGSFDNPFDLANRVIQGGGEFHLYAIAVIFSNTSTDAGLHRGFLWAANRYPSQNALMASCSACTLGKPRAAAALSRPPNCRASAATLWP